MIYRALHLYKEVLFFKLMLESRSSFSRLQRRKKLVIRSLGSGNVYAYRNLRLRALEEHPEAFATSFSEEQKQSLEETKNRLLVSPQQITHGAFKADQLVGISTLIRSQKEKLRHRAILAAMYVIRKNREKELPEIFSPLLLRAPLPGEFLM